MSTELVVRMIEALRDTAAKTEEVTERNEQVSHDPMQWGNRDTYRTIREHRYEREWVAGRLLGMADMAEAMIGSGRSLADATQKDPLP